MKIFLSLLLLLVVSASAYSQEKGKTKRSKQQYDLSPHFKVTRAYEYAYTDSIRRLPGHLPGNAVSGKDLDTNKRIPIIKHHYYSSNMPILVPDSSVHHHMQIKKFSGGKYPMTQYRGKKK